MSEHDALISRAATLAHTFEREYGGCAQCVLAAIKDSIGGIHPEVFKSATGLAGGVGLQGRACGALTGGAMALSCFYGRDLDHFADPEGVRFKTFHLCECLVNRFRAEYGSADCHDIQTRLMGRAYNLSNHDERTSYLEAGGHEDKCSSVCAKAVQWVIEILDNEGLLPDTHANTGV